MRRLPLVVVFLFSTSCPVFGWSDAGHKIVASIAFSRLTQAEREKVIEILRKHPRFKTDFVDEIPSDIEDDGPRDEWFFQQASVWPDIARGFKGDDRKEFHHGTWHYINIPHFLSDTDREALAGQLTVNVSLDPPEKPIEAMNAIQTIRLSRTLLVDRDSSRKDKAVMLTWLFHLVGDIHQPLHSTALFSQNLFRDGDRGGNRVLTKQRGNLHSLWDSFPGGKVRLKTAHRDAVKLLANGDFARLGEVSATQLNEKQWLDESHELAVSEVYSADVLGYLRNLERQGGRDIQPINIETDYLRSSGIICDQRLVQAGCRLAAVLKEIVEQAR